MRGGAWRLSLSGLRRGEVLGLAWTDVDLDGGTVNVRASRVMVAGQAVLQTSTKSLAGKRVVPLTPDAVAALRRMRSQQAQERLAAGPAYLDSGLVVVDALGRPVTPRWYADAFHALSRQAGVPVVRLHDARHAYGSHLLDRGVPLPSCRRSWGTPRSTSRQLPTPTPSRAVPTTACGPLSSQRVSDGWLLDRRQTEVSMEDVRSRISWPRVPHNVPGVVREVSEVREDRTIGHHFSPDVRVDLRGPVRPEQSRVSGLAGTKDHAACGDDRGVAVRGLELGLSILARLADPLVLRGVEGQRLLRGCWRCRGGRGCRRGAGGPSRGCSVWRLGASDHGAQGQQDEQVAGANGAPREA